MMLSAAHWTRENLRKDIREIKSVRSPSLRGSLEGNDPAEASCLGSTKDGNPSDGEWQRLEP